MTADAPTLPSAVAGEATEDAPRPADEAARSDRSPPPDAPNDPGRPAAPAEPDLADLERLLGDLVVEGEIARTPRAAVYRVRVGTSEDDRPLALKVALQPSDADDLARFRHEASLLSEVRHPNVVEVREVGVLQGQFPFLVMELVDPYPGPACPGAKGSGTKQRNGHTGALPPWATVYDLAFQAAAGLAHIHRLGVVHLDVKPGNLGLAAATDGTGDAGGRLKILDFGLAQDLRDPLDRLIRGTLAYMAPEVLLQDAWDHRADLYSLGLTLLEIATGSLPFAPGDDSAAIRFHLEGAMPDPRSLRAGMPEPLAEILARLLRRDPRERFPSAGRLLEELARVTGRTVADEEVARLALGPRRVLTSRLVGREIELARLTEALTGAQAGTSRVVVCEGVEGVGKSRLLREFRLLAAVQGAQVGFGRAEGERTRPLRPLLQALDRLGIEVQPPETASPTAGDERGRFLFYREISRRLAEASHARDATLVLALEDLHLAGAETEELLQFLAADLGSSRVLVVGCQRPAQAVAPGAPPAAERAIERLDGDDARSIDGEVVELLELRPLGPDATARLVQASLGFERREALPDAVLDWVVERSGGLPGRIQQLLRHAVDEGGLVLRDGGWKIRPQVLERLAQDQSALDWQRLEALPETLRELLEATAVIGGPFRLDTVARLLDRDAGPIYRDLAELVTRGFLERSQEGGATLYSFAGEHLGHNLYAGLEGGRRTELHRTLAALFEKRLTAGGDPELVSAVAEHYWRAGDRTESLPHLLEAARRAAQVHGHAEAAMLYRRAAEAAEATGDELAAVHAILGQARALARTGHAGRALRLYQALLDTPERIVHYTRDDGDAARVLQARLALEKGRLHGRLGEHEVALSTFEAGLGALLDDGPDGAPERGDDRLDLESELRHGAAVALRDLGQPDAAFDAARSALRRAGAAGLDRQRAFLLNTLSRMFYARGDWKRAGHLARRGLTVAERTGDPWLAILLRNSLAMVRWKTGEFAVALELFTENLAASERLNDPWGQLAALNNLGILRCSRGEWREARRLLSRSLSMNRRLGARESEAVAQINLAEVDEVLGDWRRARRHARRALDLLHGPSGTADRLATLTQLASLERKTGHLDEAERRLAEVLQGAREAGGRDLETQALLQRGQLEADRGQVGRATATLEQALELARDSETGELLGRIQLAAAEVALARGDRDAAATHSREARRQVDELGDRLTGARLLAIEARLAAGEGDDGGTPRTQRSERLFAESIERLEAIGAPYELARSLYEWGLTTGSVELATERLQRALDGFEDLGAELDAERTRGAIARIRENHSAQGAAGAGSGLSDATLHEVMRVINSTLDLDEVLDATMDMALERIGAERGMVVLADALTGELDVAVARNISRGENERSNGTEQRQLSESVVRRVLSSGEPILAVDAISDSRFAGAESIIASHILSILCVPLEIRDRKAGAIYVDHCHTRHLFSRTDLEFLQAFADGAAVAIDNARLYGELDDARRRLKAENEHLRREILASHHLGGLIGKSRSVLELKETLERVAQSTSTVLIRGESGTGKGLVGRIIHNISPRRKGPFIHFNCAALPETLVESELFGHEKGAFTGATDRKPGRFELADGGTIFLDEIGKISKAIQAKLLRVVEDKEFERVGGTRTHRTDVRIIAATNLNLEEAIERNDFREDLYYRLNIIPIVLPPLRERREDIPYLLQHFMERISRDLGLPAKRFDPAVLDLFDGHQWPGNVRELEAAVHRALVLSPPEREELGVDDFHWISADCQADVTPPEIASLAPEAIDLSNDGYQRMIDTVDRQLIEAALVQSDGKIREAARLLGIARNTLKAKMQRFEIEP